MEESLDQLWTFSIWFAGLSSTVTLVIFGWLMKIQSQIHIGESIQKDLGSLVYSVDEIKAAMIGDYEKKGLIGRHKDIERRVEEIESQMK